MQKPKIQIVNDQDEIIGHKKREEVDYSKDIFRTAALWVTNPRGEILIAQRKLTKDKDPGKWGPAVAGTVDEGETYESNIYKEAGEEIGLTDTKLSVGPKKLYKHVRSQFVQWYICIVDKPASFFIPQEDEVEEIIWISKKALLDDVKSNPDKYVPSMPDTLELFS